MKPNRLAACLVVVAPILVAGGSVRATAPAGAPVAAKVALAARPFPMTDVRLLDGPFRDAMRRDQTFLLALDPDRLLHDFRVTAGLPSTAKPLGGWEAPDVELRGHSVGHYMSALALMYASSGDERFKVRGNLMVAELAKVQQAMPSRGYHAGYLSAFPEEFFDRVEKRQRVWAPYYTIHKIMAGLLDMSQLCGNAQALDVLVKQAAWVEFRMGRLTREQQQAMLMEEHGGMTEVLANLYAVTGDPAHLRLAQAFDHEFLLGPLSRGQDPLDGLHANTQIPKIIGAAREYEMTGESRYRDVAAFFWNRVALHRSYANGGHSDDETFSPVSEFSHHLGPATSETCNTYNMLKLTRHLFSWAPSAELMDFYERGLYNHIQASQDPATGMMIYYCPLAPGAFRTYSTPDASFWCCTGTGMENHSKYDDTIYFQGDNTLFVNLFIASELRWREKGLAVRQDTTFPDEDTTSLTFTAAKPVTLAVRVRWPFWATSGIKVAVNGVAHAVAGKPGSYVAIEREWRTGDVLRVELPMTLRTEAMPDNPNVLALMYGPILLAGDLGRDSLDDAHRYGPSAPQITRLAPVTVPVLVSEPAALLPAIAPVKGRPLTFQTRGIGQPSDVTLVPLSRAADVRYNVYWTRYSPSEFAAHRREIEAAEARRKARATITIDSVDPGSADSERVHGLQQANTEHTYFEGRRGRQARSGGWFSYALTVTPGKPLLLVCSYRGTAGPRRTFDVLVDGRKIKTENLPYHPTELLDYEYPIPPDLVAGQATVKVQFQAAPDAPTAAVFDVRIVPAS